MTAPTVLRPGPAGRKSTSVYAHELRVGDRLPEGAPITSVRSHPDGLGRQRVEAVIGGAHVLRWYAHDTVEVVCEPAVSADQVAAAAAVGR
jgi:hypothetical protein